MKVFRRGVAEIFTAVGINRLVNGRLPPVSSRGSPVTARQPRSTLVLPRHRASSAVNPSSSSVPRRLPRSTRRPTPHHRASSAVTPRAHPHPLRRPRSTSVLPPSSSVFRRHPSSSSVHPRLPGSTPALPRHRPSSAGGHPSSSPLTGRHRASSDVGASTSIDMGTWLLFPCRSQLVTNSIPMGI